MMTSDNASMDNAISIVIPAFNEEQSISEVIHSLLSLYPEFEIIAVEDGSSDGTLKILETIPNIRIIRHKVNSGYGATWKSGIRAASGNIIVFYDGDGQFYPEDVGKAVSHLIENNLDLVIGSRSSMSGSPLVRRPGKWLLGKLANFLVKSNIDDLNCGLRAVRKDIIIKYIHLFPDGFSASTTSTLVFFKRHYSIGFIPIKIKDRVGESSVSFFKDGFGTIMLMARLISLFDPLRIFLPVSLILLIVSVVYSALNAFALGKGVPVLGGVLFLTSLLAFLMGLLSDQISALRLERYEQDQIPEFYSSVARRMTLTKSDKSKTA